MLVAAAADANAQDTAAEQSLERFLDRAVVSYHKGMELTDDDAKVESFRQSRRFLQKIADESGNEAATPNLYWNIGNASLLSRELGPAVLAYRRALLLDPDHAGARANISHAREQLPAWVPRPDTNALADNLLFFHSSLATEEKSLFAAIAFFMTVTLLALSIWKRWLWLRNLSMIPALIWLTLIASWAIGTAEPNAAVIVHDEAEARSADNSRAPSRFGNPLPAGTEVTVLEERGPWTQIQLADGRSAWVEAGAIERVEPPRG